MATSAYIAPNPRPPTRVCTNTCMLFLPGARTLLGGHHHLPVPDDADVRGEQADTVGIENEGPEQPGVAHRPDRVGQLEAGRRVAVAQGPDDDLRAVVGLGPVEFGGLAVGGEVGGGEGAGLG